MRKGISEAIGIVFLTAAVPAFAATPSVDVPRECTVIDTDGASHAYSHQYLGICALEAARAQGIVSEYTLQNFSFGLFLQSLNGIAPGATEFWALFHNDLEASVGLTDLAIEQGDAIKFQLTDWSAGTEVGLPIEFSIGSLIAAQNAPSPSPSGGGGEFLEERHFNVESAFDFLVSKQSADGSFGSPMLSDWAAIAFGATTDEVCNDACPGAREKLRAYVASMMISTSIATDLERHIMALEALGLNPYAVVGSPVDALVAKFDGSQMGDPSLVNDDIFAIFPLLNAGYATNDSVPDALFSFIISKQKPNGSWEDGVDLTAAAIQAIALFPERPEAAAALANAKKYMQRNQDESGIFGKSSYSLSWVLQAIAALGESPHDWTKSGITPLGYLGVFQQDDGGVEPMSVGEETRVWATSYAIPAAFGKPWDAILKDFSRPMPRDFSTASETHSTTTDETAHTKSETAQTPVHEPFGHVREPFPIEQSATTSAATNTSTESTTSHQVAAATQSMPMQNGTWLWITGLLLTLGASFYFLSRRA